VEVRVRDATLEDLSAIIEIYNSTIPSRIVSADTEPVSVEQRLPWFHEHDPARRPIRVTTRHATLAEPASSRIAAGRPGTVAALRGQHAT